MNHMIETLLFILFIQFFAMPGKRKAACDYHKKHKHACTCHFKKQKQVEECAQGLQILAKNLMTWNVLKNSNADSNKNEEFFKAFIADISVLLDISEKEFENRLYKNIMKQQLI